MLTEKLIARPRITVTIVWIGLNYATATTAWREFIAPIEGKRFLGAVLVGVGLARSYLVY